MKAAVYTSYGSPNVLNITEVEAPTPGPRDVLVQVLASPVTQGDRRLRAADFPGISRVFGRLAMGLFGPRNTIPGTQLAGRVVAVGSEVTRFAVGADVFAGSMHSAQAELIALPADGPIAHMPRNFSHAEAAALPYGALTSLVFLRDVGKIQPGHKVLIAGATGGVGRYAVQLARHLGAEVTGTARSDHDLVRELGAHHVIDHKGIPELPQNHFDIIFDTSDILPFHHCKSALTQKGRYFALHVSLRLLGQMLLTSLTRKRRAFAGVALGNAELFEDVRKLAEEGAFQPVIDRRFPFEAIREAHAHLETQRPHGDLVLTLAA